MEDARKAMREAMGEDAVKALYEQRMELMRKLSEAERVEQPASPGVRGFAAPRKAAKGAKQE